MGDGQHESASRYVRTLFNVGTVGDLTDGQLMEWFTSQGGETAELAFETLVERHGPMVLHVCRSVLHDSHEAHDAFQATFLVLMRRSRTLGVRDSLGPWLHQVAYRVAMCARSAATRRRRHERRAADLSGPRVVEEAHDDRGDVLHDEVNRLPWGCRTAVVLCYFDGLSPEQAARQLGCPVGTVQNRLARGRARLRSRLTRRGFAPALAALGAGVGAEATPIAPPQALVEATIRAAVRPEAISGTVSGSVINLTQGVLRSMFLIKLRTVAASIIAITAVAAGAQTLLQKVPAPAPELNLEQIRADLGAAELAFQREGLPETSPPPRDLAWKDAGVAERRHVIKRLAAQSKGNHDKIKTWQGSYAYVLRQYLDPQFVAQFLAGAAALGGKPAPPVKTEPLIEEFDSALTFAIDVGANAIYRDVETSRMRFLRVGTDEEVKVPNVGSADHRSIVTSEVYLVFDPKERATSAFLPDHPDAQRKRRVERFPAREAQMREASTVDPRAFFKFDAVDLFWTGLELYERVFRGDFGAEQRNVLDQRLKISQADGPGGKWYRDQMGFTNPDGSMLWVTTLWSPLAGYNPVRIVKSRDKPDGKLEATIEWQWKVIEGIYVPSTIRESVYRPTDGQRSKDQVTTLKDCTLNRPLGPHQFDERGLGMSDGDLILDHPGRVAYIIKGGEPVKLANFGEGSVLIPAKAKTAIAKPPAAAAARPRTQPTGRIYTTASLGTDDGGRPIWSIVAIDPESGDVTKVFDETTGRLRISPDGRSAAFVSGEWWSKLPPPERQRKSLWIRSFAPGARPAWVARLSDTALTGGEVPVWSADGKQIIVSESHRDESRNQWVFESFLINADGSGREPLTIPDRDGVQDWSPDGKWVVTTCSRNAKIGWQLYIMRPDGKDERQVTEGGNPFYARFSPDGRRLLYSDGPAEQRRGIWVVDLDGKNRRRILPTGKGTASACWSPDGQSIAVAISGSKPEEHGRLDIVDLDGTQRTLLTLPRQRIADMPDWR